MNMDEMNNNPMQDGEDQAPAMTPSDDEATIAPAEGEATEEGGESTE